MGESDDQSNTTSASGDPGDKEVADSYRSAILTLTSGDDESSTGRELEQSQTSMGSYDTSARKSTPSTKQAETPIIQQTQQPFPSHSDVEATSPERVISPMGIKEKKDSSEPTHDNLTSNLVAMEAAIINKGSPNPHQTNPSPVTPSATSPDDDAEPGAYHVRLHHNRHQPEEDRSSFLSVFRGSHRNSATRNSTTSGHLIPHAVLVDDGNDSPTLDTATSSTNPTPSKLTAASVVSESADMLVLSRRTLKRFLLGLLIVALVVAGVTIGTLLATNNGEEEDSADNEGMTTEMVGTVDGLDSTVAAEVKVNDTHFMSSNDTTLIAANEAPSNTSDGIDELTANMTVGELDERESTELPLQNTTSPTTPATFENGSLETTIPPTYVLPKEPPTLLPTSRPASRPTTQPTSPPTQVPSQRPTLRPTPNQESESPTTIEPTRSPSPEPPEDVDFDEEPLDQDLVEDPQQPSGEVVDDYPPASDFHEDPEEDFNNDDPKEHNGEIPGDKPDKLDDKPSGGRDVLPLSKPNEKRRTGSSR